MTECQGDCADLRISIVTKRLTPFTHGTFDAPRHHINSCRVRTNKQRILIARIECQRPDSANWANDARAHQCAPRMCLSRLNDRRRRRILRFDRRCPQITRSVLRGLIRMLGEITERKISAAPRPMLTAVLRHVKACFVPDVDKRRRAADPERSRSPDTVFGIPLTCCQVSPASRDTRTPDIAVPTQNYRWRLRSWSKCRSFWRRSSGHTQRGPTQASDPKCERARRWWRQESPDRDGPANETNALTGSVSDCDMRCRRSAAGAGQAQHAQSGLVQLSGYRQEMIGLKSLDDRDGSRPELSIRCSDLITGLLQSLLGATNGCFAELCSRVC